MSLTVPGRLYLRESRADPRGAEQPRYQRHGYMTPALAREKVQPKGGLMLLPSACPANGNRNTIWQEGLLQGSFAREGGAGPLRGEGVAE